MTNKQLKKVVDFYQKVICQQIIKPVEIQEIYELVRGDRPPMVPYYQKMRAITVYVQGLQQQVIDGLDELFTDFDEDQDELQKDTKNPMSKDYIPEDSAASPSRKLTDTLDPPQSHSEEVTELPEKGELDFNDPNTVVDTRVSDEDLEKIPQEILDKAMLVRLEEDYELATTANEKRSLKMRINKMKKDGSN